jgi:cobalt-zinc-cadmium efflux system outer membrane protein
MSSMIESIKAHSLRIIYTSFLSFACSVTTGQTLQNAYSLQELESMMLANSKAVLGVTNTVESARFAVRTAQAVPNPQIEVLNGTRTPRTSTTNIDGALKTISVTQDLDMPWHRIPRVDAATANLGAAQANEAAFKSDMVAKLRVRYFELIRRLAEERASKEDSKLMEGIRSRIALRVETGEAARFELFKADAELLNTQKLAQSAGSRIKYARAGLRALVGAQLPEQFSIHDFGVELPPPPPIEKLRDHILQNNPELTRARAERQQLDSKLNQEKAFRFPKIALRADQDLDSEYKHKRIGVALTLPLWDWRSGPIGEASARLSQSVNELAYQEFSLLQSLEAAYQQYEIAQSQMFALESGIVRQAANAVRVVEIAYKAGEKGFLEVLDAQRVYRSARNELIVARFELASAWTEIERLRATVSENPN